MNRDLHTFVRDALSRGVSREQLRAALREAHWPDAEIDSELAGWHDAGLGLPVPRRRVGVSAREAFLYLLLFVALYLVCFHAGAILFALIEWQWPDAMLRGLPGRHWDGVRFSVATLLVAFPVYVVTSRFVGRSYEADPEQRHSAVRRWLTYLTLFNAACLLIGDLIGLILGALNGGLTTPFLAKAAVVACLGLWVFMHYLGGLRRDESEAPLRRRSVLGARAAGALVVIVGVVGLWLAGAPEKARQGHFDRERLTDLQMLSTAVITDRQTYRAVPPGLDVVARRNTGIGLRILDPVTNLPYGYTALGDTAFMLCASFDAPDSIGPEGSNVSEFWRHEAGPHCYTIPFPR